MALIDSYYKQQRKLTNADKARITFTSFCAMMFGVKKPHESGTLGLKGPMPYPAFFLIVFILSYILAMVIF